MGRIATDRRYGAAPVSQHQRRNTGTRATTIITATRGGRAIPVTVGEWSAGSDPDFPGNVYADIVHGLGTAHAIAVAWRDVHGNTFSQQTFDAQTPTPSAETSTVRVWLRETPSDTITVYIAAFA